MASKRPDRDFEGAGVNISLAIAGVVAAGIGLMTMHTAFKPLPKPGVPVVISHAAVPAPTLTSWRHVTGSRPAAHAVSTRPVEQVDAIAPVRASSHLAAVRHQDAEAAAVAAPPAAQPAKITATAPAPPAKPPVQVLAKVDVAADKLCKAPTPQLISAKALQPAMILRYDSKFKAPTPDIEPQRFTSDDEQRRLKLSALLSRVLEN